MYFTYGSDSLPRLRGLNFDDTNAFILEASQKNDTLTYWLADTTLVNQDTLLIEATYLMTDSTGMLVEHIDSVMEFTAKVSYEKRLKDKQKEYEDWKKEQDKKKKRKEPYDSVMAVKPLTVKMSANGRVAPNQRFYMEMPQPLNRCDTSAIHLNMVVDSLLKPVPCELRQLSVRRYELVVEWQEGEEYSLEIDSAAFEGIYGLTSNTMKQTIKVGTVDDYSSLLVEVSGVSLTDSIVVQLLDGSDKVVRQSVADAEGVAEFLYLKPGAYYLRAYAQNSYGTAYSTQRTLTTTSAMPTVSTFPATSITSTSAISGGNIRRDGGLPILRRGVCFSTSPVPTIEGNHTTDGSGNGQFVSNLTGLLPATTYYIRAYATNAAGTAYGEQYIFVTQLYSNEEE